MCKNMINTRGRLTCGKVKSGAGSIVGQGNDGSILELRHDEGFGRTCRGDFEAEVVVEGLCLELMW